MKTMIIDPGHGGVDPGARYKGYEEKTLNLNLALKVRDYLQNRYDVKILMTRSDNKTLSLEERSDYANRTSADFFLSIHHNAGGGRGFESYTFNGSVSSETLDYQKVIHDAFIKRLKKNYRTVIDRGQKRANFHVLRETKMPSLLVEVLFIDNDADLAVLTNPSFNNDAAAFLAEGVAAALSLPEKQSEASLYKVIAGSFKDKENAEKRLEFLKKNKFEGFIDSEVVNGTTFYRVQVGAFSERANAENLVDDLKRVNVEAFITGGESKEAPVPLPTEPAKEDGVTILGESLLYGAQLDEFVRSINPSAPLLGDDYIKFGSEYGIRGDIAFCQAIHETDFFRFTGQVRPSQNNFAGIGTTGPGVDGASFKTPEDGVLAHIQHLYAYASKEKAPSSYSVIDPRFSLVSRGSAKNWTDLNGKWAVPGTTYGQSILSVYGRNLKHALQQLEKQQKDIQGALDLLS
ncbi:N-acetylmuramoyl-L-alanine amidase [Rossellomorea aquimaris]|uniref:N-acetylmuramoyl-L-alanine amidase n=1 Tax=Rossellomorea aquimaris TaxID=189382 RepID=UPI001CD6475B|nr:N-acetylmuramoyl-L-alanine amidase [Rossellomorea aquimaris]MCA1056487.1 N-acetylmuramoyl-L-alanine amidase [Rossellomorea aquimaris]